QTIGETGWQLSHGERSRIFLARALLQDAQLTVLDESFAALDPETLQKCLNCALRRARALVVIAHPYRPFRRKPAPDLIRGGRRFADKNMRQTTNLEHVPIP